MNMGTIMDVTLDLLKKHNTGTPPHHFFFENAKILGGLDRSNVTPQAKIIGGVGYCEDSGPGSQTPPRGGGDI